MDVTFSKKPGLLSLLDRSQWLAGLALFCFMFLTTPWFSYEEGKKALEAWDTAKYMRIADAVPGYPQSAVTYHHAQRFIFPYVSGLLAQALHVDVLTIARSIVLVCFVLIFFLFGKTVESRFKPFLLCATILILSPYTFRYYLEVPLMGNDVLFVLGTALIYFSLLKEKEYLLPLGFLLATATRQNGLLLLPLPVYWYWKRWDRRKIIFYSFAVLASVSVFRFTAHFAHLFGTSDTAENHIFALFRFFQDWVHGDAFYYRQYQNILPGEQIHLRYGRIFIELIVRAITPLWVPLAIILAIFLGKRKVPRSRDFWAMMVATLLLCFQPMLSAPYLHDVVRLNGLANLALLIALAIQMKEAGAFETSGLSARWLGIFVLLILGSFHHKRSSLFYLEIPVLAFTLFYWAAAIGIAVLVFLSLKSGKPSEAK